MSSSKKKRPVSSRPAQPASPRPAAAPVATPDPQARPGSRSGKRAEAAAARQARKQQEERAAAKQAMKRRLIVIGVVVAVVAAGLLFFNNNRQKAAELQAALTAGSCTTDSEADKTAPIGQNHVLNPTYTVNPPSAGNHLVSNARAGVYPADALPPDGELVHSLEHGYVIYWHDGELAEDKVGELEELERQHPGDIIVAERPGMPVPVAATAWGKRLLCQDVEAEALKRFAGEYIGRGPEKVARG
jgi:hypothetical protein